MIKFLTSIWKWFSDPKNKVILRLILVVSLIAIILMQCSNNKGLKQEISEQKAETQRIQNNFEALSAPLIQNKINDSTLLAERLALKLTVDELKKSNSELLLGFEKFKKQNPKVIEKITIVNNETIREIPVYAKLDSLGNGVFTFEDSANFADNNFRKIKGTLPFTNTFFNKKDSTMIDFNKVDLYTKINPGPATFDLEQRIKLKVGLFEDPKTKKITIAATTSYPGITFTQLDGADIVNDEASKKAVRSLRKTWGIGFSVGYGAGVNLKTSQVFFGPQVGIGITYTPKLLQWGK